MKKIQTYQQKITPFLWYNNNAEEAVNFYISVFKNSKIISQTPYGDEGPGPVDELWEILSEDGEKQQCGWLKDKFGLSWQIVPTILGEMLNDKDSMKANKVMKAMLKMDKLDIETLMHAYNE